MAVFIPLYIYLSLCIFFNPSLSCNDTRQHVRARSVACLFFCPISLSSRSFFFFLAGWTTRLFRCFLASCFAIRRNNWTRPEFWGWHRKLKRDGWFKTRLSDGDERHDTFYGLQRYYVRLIANSGGRDGPGQSHIHVLNETSSFFFSFSTI